MFSCDGSEEKLFRSQLKTSVSYQGQFFLLQNLRTVISTKTWFQLLDFVNQKCSVEIYSSLFREQGCRKHLLIDLTHSILNN